MIIVTGGAGFIGSNLVRALNARGQSDILVVDDLEKSAKFSNLSTCQIADYLDKRDFGRKLEAGQFGQQVEVIYHQGACADTLETDGRYMLDNNFSFSKLVLDYALARRVPLVYASSAAVYGNGPRFAEDPACEKPLNVYGYSKLLFDQHVRRRLSTAASTVVGLRYFNVYGPNETHKGRMASMPHQCLQQLRQAGRIRLFGETEGYGAGEQRRDFVFVGDVVALNFFFAEGPVRQGLYNAGTGQSRSFNDLARSLILQHGRGEIEYFPFPDALRGKYQDFTQADPAALRAAGYTTPFTSLENGLSQLYQASLAA
jgi:ADP-L-glycero-D-manno-heptose 6-epimerase